MNLRTDESVEAFADRVERLRSERETQPDECSHCQTTTIELTNYSREYGGNVGGHWLCTFCEVTLSASRLGAGLSPEVAVQDVAAMLNRLVEILGAAERTPK